MIVKLALVGVGRVIPAFLVKQAPSCHWYTEVVRLSCKKCSDGVAFSIALRPLPCF